MTMLASFLDPYLDYASTYVDWPYLYVLGNTLVAVVASAGWLAGLSRKGRSAP